MTEPSPLAADTLPNMERPKRSILIAAALGAVIGNLLASALVVWVALNVVAGFDLPFRELAGLTILAAVLRSN